MDRLGRVDRAGFESRPLGHLGGDVGVGDVGVGLGDSAPGEPVGEVEALTTVTVASASSSASTAVTSPLTSFSPWAPSRRRPDLDLVTDGTLAAFSTSRWGSRKAMEKESGSFTLFSTVSWSTAASSAPQELAVHRRLELLVSPGSRRLAHGGGPPGCPRGIADIVLSRSRSGPSMSLATASCRHMAGSWYSAQAIEARVSPATTRWLSSTPYRRRGVGGGLPVGNSCRVTLQVARSGSPFSLKRVYLAATLFTLRVGHELPHSRTTNGADGFFCCFVFTRGGR